MAQRTEKDYYEQDKVQRIDHDSILRLEGKVDQIISDIRELKDGFAFRIQCLEEKVEKLDGLRIKVVGIMITVSVALGIFGLYIRGFIEDIFRHIYK